MLVIKALQLKIINGCPKLEGNKEVICPMWCTKSLFVKGHFRLRKQPKT